MIPARRSANCAAIRMLGAAAVGAACCASAQVLAVPFGDDGGAEFVRSTTRDGLVALDTGTTIYRRADGTGPTVALVGVVHIGDKAYYARLVELLDRHEMVLFESVMPRGSFGAGGADDGERRRTTLDVMEFLTEALASHVTATGELPETLAALRTFMASRDSRAARSIDLAMVDGWGNPIRYERRDALLPVLASLGADGAEGGDGAAADIVETGFDRDVSVPEERARPQGGGASRKGASGKRATDLYATLANALETDTQLAAIDYDRPNWWPSDMSSEQLRRRLQERGVRNSVVDLVSAGDGLQLGLIRVLLGMVSKSPEFKRTVIKMLGSAGEQTRGAGLNAQEMAVILDERNEVVVARLRELLAAGTAAGTAPRSIAVFYGAAHMPGIGASLEREFGMVPVESMWFTAMSADGWSAEKVDARIAALERARTALTEGDREGAFPACVEIDARIDALRARAASRSLRQ